MQTKAFKFSFLLFFVLTVSSILAQDFSGIIDFRRINPTDTNYFKYFIQNDNVRIEDISKTGEVNGIMLLDLVESNIQILSGKNKVYFNVPASVPNPQTIRPKLNMTKDTLVVDGKTCTKWVVIDKVSKTKCEYWVHNDRYTFFNKMLNLLNRDEYVAKTWLAIEADDVYFPLIGTSFDEKGELLNKVETLTIIKKELSDSLFTIPDDYQLVEKARQ